MMQVPFLSDLNKLISNSKIENFIKASELTFNDHISEVAKIISQQPDLKMVLISGPSSSGKTTTTKRLSSYLETLGLHPIPISVDDYYKDEEDYKKDKVENYEVIEALDLKVFNEDINQLIEGHCLNDELTKDIENKYKYKIYLSPFIPLAIDRHNYVSTVDLRLLRRITRDNRLRGTDVSETINSWQTVRDGEEKYIFPYIHQADAVINTAYAFEVGVLKVFVEPLLYSVGLDSPYYEEARRLINYIQGFLPISSEFISKDSILREFIG